MRIPPLVVLETDRLSLRVCQPADSDAVFAAEQESIEELRRWFWWCHPEHLRERSAVWAESRVEAWHLGQEFSFLIFEKTVGRLAGCIMLNRIDFNANSASLGYWLRTACGGRGLALEATEAIVRWSCEELCLQRIHIRMAATNDRSRKLAERLGALPRGVEPGGIVVNGSGQDAFVYELLCDEPAEATKP